MALSSQDQAAVLKAAQQGGLSSSQGQTIVSAANQNKTVNVNAPPTAASITSPSSSGGSSSAPAFSNSGLYLSANSQYYDSQGNQLTSAEADALMSKGAQITYDGAGQIIPTLPAQKSKTAQPTTQQPTTSTQPAVTQPTTTEQPASKTQGSLTMPASGSVVDLLNMAGQDSSFAARSALAQQYGIQNYTGTAAQNTTLAQKYLAAHTSLKGSAVPQTPADARSAIQSYQDANQTAAAQDPTQQFYDAYASMDPVMKSVYDAINQTLSTINTRTSLTEEISKLPEFKERNDVKAELLDVKRIMDGTEDDIRDEITNSGGFATESQVQALAGARNKVLLKQANALTDQFNVLNDYVNQITDLTKADREQVDKDLQTKLGLATTMFTMQQSMQNAARENYKMIVDSVGWTGLAQSLQGNPIQTAKVEKLFGMAPGELAALGSYVKPLTAEEQLRNQNLQLQNAKLSQDLKTGPAVQTQVIDIGGKKVLINSKTGAVISDISANFAPDKSVQLAQGQQTILDTSGLLNDPILSAAVGATAGQRVSPFNQVTTGARSNFLAGVQQLQNQLTLQNLQNAKANGATFGALSDSELGLLSSSASKLSTWAVKDNAGNITGYATDEKNFKQELDKINNFSKLDYILKGGDPASVGVQQMPDGTLWTKNSDGSYVKLQ